MPLVRQKSSISICLERGVSVRTTTCRQRRLRPRTYLVGGDHLRGDLTLTLEHSDGDIGVELGESGSGDLSTGLANILLAEEELSSALSRSTDALEVVADAIETHLRSKIRNLHRRGVVNSDALDSCESNVLGWRVS